MHDGPEFVDFYNSGDRMYSIEALGYVGLPTIEWLPPISLDNFVLNENATLPIKFSLGGAFVDVTLVVNGEPIEIKYQCDEECGDFYMGLFRPPSSGNQTVQILVNGILIEQMSFEVFEVVANGKGKGPK